MYVTRTHLGGLGQSNLTGHAFAGDGNNNELLVSIPRDAYAYSTDYAVARCLSVCLSQTGIVSKRLHIFLKFFHRWVAPHF